jgi:hypothetical protein
MHKIIPSRKLFYSQENNVEDQRKKSAQKALKKYGNTNADRAWRAKNVKKVNLIGLS